jgi:hypothetical protein
VKSCSPKSSIQNLRSEILNLKSELFLQARSGTSLGEQLLETPFDFAQGRLRTRRERRRGRGEKPQRAQRETAQGAERNRSERRVRVAKTEKVVASSVKKGS